MLGGAGRLSPLLVAAGLVPAVLACVPLSITLAEALGGNLDDVLALLLRPLVGELLVNTLSLAAATTICAAIVGTATAWAVERTDVPGRSLWGTMSAAPLAIPPFITGYAWVSISNGLQDFWGAALVVTSAYFPLVYLPVAAALRGVDPVLEEVATSLGRGGWQRFWQVIMPQIRGALLGGMLLVALNTMVEFGAFALLRYRTFTTTLYTQYRVGLDGPQSAVLACALLVPCLACLFLEYRLGRLPNARRAGKGTSRRAKVIALGQARWLVAALLGALASVTIGVPCGTVIFWLFRHVEAATSPVLPSGQLLVAASVNSVALGLTAAVVTIAIAMPLAYLSVRHSSGWVAAIERLAYLPQGVPAIVVALALISVSVQVVLPLYQSAALLVLTYAILFTPLALVGARAAFSQVQPAWEEMSRSLGVGGMAMVLRVILPLAAPGLAAGAAIVFISVTTELTATLLLAPIGTVTLATEIWSDTSAMAFAAAAPFAAVMLVSSLAGSWLIARRFGATSVLGAS